MIIEGEKLKSVGKAKKKKGKKDMSGLVEKAPDKKIETHAGSIDIELNL